MFLSQYFSFPVSTIPPMLHTNLHLTCCYYQDKWAKPGNLPKKKAILFGKSGSTGYGSTYFHIAFKRLTLEARTVIPPSDGR